MRQDALALEEDEILELKLMISSGSIDRERVFIRDTINVTIIDSESKL